VRRSTQTSASPCPPPALPSLSGVNGEHGYGRKRDAAAAFGPYSRGVPFWSGDQPARNSFDARAFPSCNGRRKRRPHATSASRMVPNACDESSGRKNLGGSLAASGQRIRTAIRETSGRRSCDNESTARWEGSVALVADGRKPLFVIATPLEGLSNVTLYEDTWTDHIVKGHPVMADKQELVRMTTAAPTVITLGTSNQGYMVFVNQAETSSSGSPLTVVIDPRDQIICTAYYNRSFRTIVQERVLWLP
jgi:hypothetical protein